MTHLDPAEKRLLDDEGTEYQYEKLLLATGGMPRRLPFGGDAVIYYWRVQDFRQLKVSLSLKSNSP